MMNERIRHMAFFTLKHEKGTEETEKFLQEGKAILTRIPGVEHFQVLQQTSPKMNFDFGFSMEFANEEAYQMYNNHPEHQQFVKTRWEVEVERFQEVDYIVIN